MNMIMHDRSLSLLRLLTSSYIDEEAAELLLAGEPMDILLDIQTVMVIGMAATEAGREDVFVDPKGVYEKHRRIIPAIGDREDEVHWMLQPDYKSYLQSGMRVLFLR